MLPKIKPNDLPTWNKLKAHQKELAPQHMRDWFNADPQRAKAFSLEFQGVLWDFSKNHLQAQTVQLLAELFDQCQMKAAIDAMFDGRAINETENRAVLHTALRNFSGRSIAVDGQDVMPAVEAVRQKMQRFSQNVISGTWRGHTGEAVTDVVNIGIGGSDLGPAMVYDALRPYRQKHIRCHFVSNVDGAHLAETLDGLNPATTLFIIASKSFSTQETMTNARSARQWYLQNGGSETGVKKHFVAVSTHRQKVTEFGIDPENMFEFWDWVGGRYSVWSAIGLPLCCGLGYENFEQLLRGAHVMDEHFRTSPFSENIPMLMAGIGLWYTNFWEARSEAIIPYSQNLHRFAAYFQQGNMESNGKYTNREGQPVDYPTGPIVWGEPGTNGQHAFFQLLHQGTHLIPCDFIGFVNSPYRMPEHQDQLMANFFAQTEALMRGRTAEEVAQEANAGSALAQRQAPHRVFPGNRPTTTILAQQPDPATLGLLIAVYEHKIFTQGVVWNIFSFDQWGVELGKELAGHILPELKGESATHSHDHSTNQLVQYYRQNQW